MPDFMLEQKCLSFSRLKEKKAKILVEDYREYSSKEDRAKAIIAESFRLFQFPIVACSFGKDSIVLWSMVKEFFPDIPVMFLMDGKPMRKSLYSFETAARLGVQVYTYPPSFSTYIQKDDFFDVINWYYVNGIDWYVLYCGCYPVNGGEYSCAVNDLLDYPKINTYDFRWDCVFHGQNQSDDIHILKTGYKIKTPIMPFGNGILSMPLFDWTDDDVWAYIKTHNLPFQKERYLDNPQGIVKDESCNRNSSDVLPTCFTCLDYRKRGEMVYCPRYGGEIENKGKSREEIQKEEETILMLAKYIKPNESE